MTTPLAGLPAGLRLCLYAHLRAWNRSGGIDLPARRADRSRTAPGREGSVTALTSAHCRLASALQQQVGTFRCREQHMPDGAGRFPVGPATLRQTGSTNPVLPG